MHGIHLHLVRVFGHVHLKAIIAQRLGISVIHDIEKQVLVEAIQHLGLLAELGIVFHLHVSAFREIDRHLGVGLFRHEGFGQFQFRLAARKRKRTE